MERAIAKYDDDLEYEINRVFRARTGYASSFGNGEMTDFKEEQSLLKFMFLQCENNLVIKRNVEVEQISQMKLSLVQVF